MHKPRLIHFQTSLWDPYGTLWDLMGPYGTLMGPYGTLWDLSRLRIYACMTIVVQAKILAVVVYPFRSYGADS